jgi:hypothetical protein
MWWGTESARWVAVQLASGGGVCWWAAWCGGHDDVCMAWVMGTDLHGVETFLSFSHWSSRTRQDSSNCVEEVARTWFRKERKKRRSGSDVVKSPGAPLSTWPLDNSSPMTCLFTAWTASRRASVEVLGANTTLQLDFYSDVAGRPRSSKQLSLAPADSGIIDKSIVL